MVNVKGIFPNFNSVTPPAKAPEKKSVKSSETDEDRDANGKREDQNDQPYHGPMTDEESEQVLEAMKNLPGIKENHLTVEIVQAGDTKVAIVKDPYGKVVRRIPESGLWHFLQQKEDPTHTGQLLNKAM